MSENQEHDGDYKVYISDKGTLKFTLNWKWAVGILTTVLLAFGYLAIDKYYTVPMKEKNDKIIILDQRVSTLEEINNQLLSNQKILLDRSNRLEKWLDNLMDNNNETPPTLPQSNGPGN